MNNSHHAEIVYRLAELQKFLAGFEPTRLPIEPYPSEIREVNKDVERLVHFIDPIFQAIAEQVIAYTNYQIDKSLYVNQLGGALFGNLDYEIGCAADALHQEMMEAIA